MTSPAAAPGSTRRIVANFFLTLDGVMEAPETWQFPYFNEEMGAAVGAGMATTDALLMGATLYREWSQQWPDREGELADIFNSIPKYVVSDSLERVEWSGSTLLSGVDAADRLRALKAEPGGDIAVSGSATLVRWLLREGLLDELHLLVCPVLLGSGRRLFEQDVPALPMALASAQTFSTGVLHLTYRPAAS